MTRHTYRTFKWSPSQASHETPRLTFNAPKSGIFRNWYLSARISTRFRERGKTIEICIYTKGKGEARKQRESMRQQHRSFGPEFNYSSRGGLWLPRQPDKPGSSPVAPLIHLRDTSRCIPVCLDAPVFVYCTSSKSRTFSARSHRPIVRLGVNDRVAIIRARS